MNSENDDVEDDDPESDAVGEFFAKEIFRRLLALTDQDNWQFETKVPWRYDALLGIDGARNSSTCRLQAIFQDGDKRDERPWVTFQITTSGIHAEDGTPLFDWLRATFPE